MLKKAFILGMVIAVALPTTALGALLPTDQNYKGDFNQVVTQSDGSSTEYFAEYNGKIFTDLPKIITTVTPADNSLNTVKYEMNAISHDAEAGVDHQIDNTGAYMTVSNVLRQSAYSGLRILYAQGPVSVTISGSYTPYKGVTKFSKYAVENGKVLYNISYDNRTDKTYAKDIMVSSVPEDKTVTLDGPGLYLVSIAQEMSAYIYVTDGTEDVSYQAPSSQTATATSATVSVNGQTFTSYGYTINGENYVRLRDLAYMLNGTGKQFDVAEAPGMNMVTIKTFDNASYTAVGGEITEVPSGTQTADPSTKNYAIDGTQINPTAYTINGTDYVKLTDLAKIVDISSTNNGGAITINTSTGYVEVKKPPVLTVTDTERLAGNDRYQTAVAISKAGWSQSDNVVLASGTDYHDALVGSSFAYLKDAPILLTAGDSLNSDTRAEIQRLGAKNVYILGSEASVSQAIENDLKQSYNVVRIGGSNVLDTAVAVGTEVNKIKPVDTVAIATDINFPDALSLAPFSAKNSMPILFTDQYQLRADTKQALQDWGVKTVVIAGGTAVVSSQVADEISSMGIKVYRKSGNDRYDTDLEVMKYFQPDGGYKDIAIATGENFPDVLAGAVLAAKYNMPIVLVQGDRVNDDIASYLSSGTLDKAYIFGGSAVVSTRITGN